MKRKRALAAIAIASIVISSFTGCKQKEKVEVSKGRYVEEEIKFPQYETDERFLKITASADGMPTIYSYIPDGDQININKYTYQENGEFSKESPKWLQEIPFQKDTEISFSVAFAEDGTEYALVTGIPLVTESPTDQKSFSDLYVTSDGNERKEQKMEGFQSIHSDKSGDVEPLEIRILKNHKFVVSSDDGYIIYNSEGKKESTIHEEGFLSAFYVNENDIIIPYLDGGTEELKGIYTVDGSQMNPQPKLKTFDETQEYTEAFNGDATGDIFYVNSSGINIQKAHTDIWQTELKGNMGVMYAPAVSGEFISRDSEKNYYVMYHDYNEAEDYLMKYHYDETLDSVPAHKLTVYSLNYSNTLRKAVVLYQRKHPDVEVDVQVAMPLDYGEGDSAEVLTKADYIKSLNTQILANDGYDIINLTDLPGDEYIEKGVLEDLTDEIKPLYDEKKVLTNIFDTYKKEDKFYSIPIRFSLDYTMVSQKEKNNINNLDSFYAYAKEHKTSPLFQGVNYEQLIEYFMPHEMSQIILEDGQIQEEKLKDVLTKLKEMYDQAQENADIFDLTYMADPSVLGQMNVDVSLYNENDYDFMVYQAHYLRHFKYKQMLYGQDFKPTLEVGVSKNSKNKKFAKEFVLSLLDMDLQKRTMSDGYPVVTEGVDGLHADVEGQIPIFNEDRSYTLIPQQQLSEEERQSILNDMKTANHKITMQEDVKNIFISCTKDYFTGSQSIDDTVTDICNKLKMLTQE